MSQAAALALEAVRREVARRAAAGVEDAGIVVDALATRLEADAAAREALEALVDTRRREDPLGESWRAPPGPRLRRERRLTEARRAVGELVLAGDLAPDGPGRVRLPGFGASTWRAVGILRLGAAGSAARWAETVAAPPAADLGPAAPAFLRGLRPRPGLVETAARLHRAEALRQDARNALLAAAAAIGAALDRGYPAGAAALRAECADLEARIAARDAEIAAWWAEGLRRAAAG